MSTLVTTPSEVSAKHLHTSLRDSLTGNRVAARPSERHGTDSDSISDASQAELHRRLKSLRAGLATLAREHLLADSEAFDDTMSVLHDEITDLLAVVTDSSQPGC